MIYCVEDDDSIRELILYTLQSTGFEAKGFCCAEDMFAVVNKEKPSLIILDIMLPGKDGIEILKALRADKATADILIMLATAKGTEFDKVYGLDTGADDYLVKPFGMMELLARVKALLRRKTAPVSDAKDESATLGIIKVDPIKRAVTVEGVSVALTYKEFEILWILMQEPERVFTRDNLLNTVWGYEFDGETRTVDVHMRSLRHKLGAGGLQIQTIRGVGYSICDSTAKGSGTKTTERE